MAERDRDERAILEAFECFERELAAPDVSGAVRAELGIRPRGRRAAAVLAAVIAAALLITGCAAAFGGLEWLSSRLGAGGFTDVLEPQEAAAEREGIEMTVLGAQGFGDSAAAYISLRDTAGLGRVREEPGCQAVFAINGTGRTEQVYFDEETGTGYYVVLAYDENGGLSGPAEIALWELNYSPEGGTKFGPEEVMPDFASAAALGPSAAEGELLPVERGAEIEPWLWLGAVGTVGGRPAVQIGVDSWGDCRDYNFKLALRGPDGETPAGDGIIGFLMEDMSPWDGSESEVRYLLYQYVFDIDPAELPGLTLEIEGRFSGSVRSGWTVEVELSDAASALTYTGDIVDEDGGTLVSGALVTLTPLGIRIEGRGEPGDIWRLASYRVYAVTPEGWRGANVGPRGAEDDGSFDWFLFYTAAVEPESVERIEFGRLYAMELK